MKKLALITLFCSAALALPFKGEAYDVRTYAKTTFDYLGDRAKHAGDQDKNGKESADSLKYKAAEAVHMATEKGTNLIGGTVDKARADFHAARGRLVATGLTALSHGERLAVEVMEGYRDMMHEVLDSCRKRGEGMAERYSEAFLNLSSKTELAKKALDAAQKSIFDAHDVEGDHSA